mgnify:CR=1 FL=1
MPVIEEYSFGLMVVDGKTYTNDLIIFPERIQPEWWRESGHSLCREDIEEILEEKPDVLVIGTGSSGVMDVPPETMKLIREEGIELVIEPTARAVDAYNRISPLRPTVGAFHLTC